MKLKFFDLNCWLLPFGISRKNKIRKEQILIEIKKKNPDIITLQEVWLIKDINYFKKHLKNYHPVHSNSLFFNKSGLLTLTKEKPSEVKKVIFPIAKRSSLIERIGAKGLHSINLAFKRKKLHIINVHLYFPIKKEDKLIDFLELKFINHLINKSTIVLGDLNLNYNSLKKWRKYDSFKLGGRKPTYSSKDVYAKKYGDKRKFFRDKIDYSLLSKKSKLKLVSKTITAPVLSDHYALEGTVSI